MGLQTLVIPPQSPYGLPLNETTIAQQLRSAGYRTHAVGKVRRTTNRQAQYLPRRSPLLALARLNTCSALTP